jgi:nicotinamidase-related amidase
MNEVLRRVTACLLVVDVQEKLAAVMPHREPVIERCVRLVQGFRKLGLPVHVTEQYPEGLGPTVPELREATAGIEPLVKSTFSCCGLPEDRDHPLMQRLAASGRRQVVLCGMEAHVCVLQTALVLAGRGVDVHVVEDAVCSRDDGHRQNALDRLRAAGITVTNHESALFEVLEDSAAPEFRHVAKLVR